jgi:HK97 family phage major capsid protein
MELDELKSELKSAVAPVMTAFEEYKKTNDERIVQLEKKGGADPVTTDKLDKIEKTLSAYEGLNQKVTTAEQQAKALEKKTEEQANIIAALETKFNRPNRSDPAARLTERKAVWNTWTRGVVDAHVLGLANLTDGQRKAISEATEEYKALGLVPDTASGYLAPVDYVLEIIKGETELSPVRGLVNVRTTGMKSVQQPKRTGQFSAVWVADQGTKTETTGLAYGLEEINTHEVYALIDIANASLEDAAFDMENEIRTESSLQFDVATGAAVVSGNSKGKPEGFLQNAAVLTTNSGSAAAITADGMLSLKFGIKTAYTRNASWTLNRTTIGSVRKLKDSTNNYLWMPGIAQGRPNTIDGDPYVELPDMPSEAAGAKPLAYGDFRRAYTLVDRLSMQLLRDPYTQATAGNIRFIMRRRIGGQVVLAEAIRVMVCST